METKGIQVVKRVNFDTNVFAMKDNGEVMGGKVYRSRERYRFNDIKIDLTQLKIEDSIFKKSPIIRLQVALRDKYGVCYDTFYHSMCDTNFEYSQTFESLIYENTEEITMQESFFVRIPTKSLETLKTLYLIFMVQILA